MRLAGLYQYRHFLHMAISVAHITLFSHIIIPYWHTGDFLVLLSSSHLCFTALYPYRFVIAE